MIGLLPLCRFPAQSSVTVERVGVPAAVKIKRPDFCGCRRILRLGAPCVGTSDVNPRAGKIEFGYSAPRTSAICGQFCNATRRLMAGRSRRRTTLPSRTRPDPKLPAVSGSFTEAILKSAAGQSYESANFPIRWRFAGIIVESARHCLGGTRGTSPDTRAPGDKHPLSRPSYAL
jgi:hypothetical protein